MSVCVHSSVKILPLNFDLSTPVSDVESVKQVFGFSWLTYAYGGVEQISFQSTHAYACSSGTHIETGGYLKNKPAVQCMDHELAQQCTGYKCTIDA